MKKGIVVATDQGLEWLLPWWWELYSACNSLPVAFVDFGMSAEKRAWCKQRGEVVSFHGEEIAHKPIPQELYAKWEAIYSPFWHNYTESYQKLRKVWFKKPAACLLSPFDQSLWIDLDCEILDCIDPMFLYLKEGKEICVFFDCMDVSQGIVCNGGVIAFKKESRIIQEWAKRSVQESEKYWGDDHLLAEIVGNSIEQAAALPEIYNWRICKGGLPLHAKIIHWCGEWGKMCLAEHGGLKKAIEQAKKTD